jgi:hypothetical protein
LWSASDTELGVGKGAILMISSSNSLTSPVFNYTAGSNPVGYAGGAGSHSWAPMYDINGNVWVVSEDQLNEVTCFSPCTENFTANGDTSNYNSSFTQIYGATTTPWDGGVTRYAAMDGDGKIELSSASGNFGFVSVYYPNAPSDGAGGAGLGGADVYLNPCFAPNTGTCAETTEGSSQIVNASREIVVDSTGAIWATLSSGKNVIQLLGPGAPTWSQQSWVPAAFLTNMGGSGRPY